MSIWKKPNCKSLGYLHDLFGVLIYLESVGIWRHLISRDKPNNQIREIIKLLDQINLRKSSNCNYCWNYVAITIPSQEMLNVDAIRHLVSNCIHHISCINFSCLSFNLRQSEYVGSQKCHNAYDDGYHPKLDKAYHFYPMVYSHSHIFFVYDKAIPPHVHHMLYAWSAGYWGIEAWFIKF